MAAAALKSLQKSFSNKTSGFVVTTVIFYVTRIITFGHDLLK